MKGSLKFSKTPSVYAETQTVLCSTLTDLTSLAGVRTWGHVRSAREPVSVYLWHRALQSSAQFTASPQLGAGELQETAFTLSHRNTTVRWQNNCSPYNVVIK